MATILQGRLEEEADRKGLEGERREVLITSIVALPAVVLGGIAVACIGPTTAETARSYGLEPTLSAEEYTIDGLTEALVRYFAGLGHERKGASLP
jgi:uroporphyrinogen-III synthase